MGKAGGFPNPIALGTDNTVYQHEFGNSANGDVLSWYAETGALDLAEGDNFFDVHALIPDFEEQQGAMTIEVYTRNERQSDWALKKTLSLSVNDTGPLWMTVSGRQMKAKYSQSAMPAFARFGGVQLMINPTGAER